MKIKVKKLNPDAKLPRYSHKGDAGADLYSIEDKILRPMERYGFHTGISMEIPEAYVGLIKDRSGLAVKNGLHTLAGVIDSEYRGEIGVVLINLGQEDFEIKGGDRIAQLLIQKVENAEFTEADELSDTARKQGGFGSTGK